VGCVASSIFTWEAITSGASHLTSEDLRGKLVNGLGAKVQAGFCCHIPAPIPHPPHPQKKIIIMHCLSAPNRPVAYQRTLEEMGARDLTPVLFFCVLYEIFL
jgi:hypothetical protein